MSFLHSETYYPAAGREADLQSTLRERVRILQAEGVDAALSTVAWGPEHPALIIDQRYAALADYERVRSQESGEGPGAFSASIASLLRSPMVTTLAEILQEARAALTPARWTDVLIQAPLEGKGPELRPLLMERGEAYEAMGRRTSLHVQVAGPETGVFTRVAEYDSLAEYEETRTRITADEGERAYARRLTGLRSRPAEWSIREVLVPYPPR